MTLPSPDTRIQDMTLDELRALLALHQEELRTEWCVTLIMQSIDEVQAEIDRRAAAGKERT